VFSNARDYALDVYENIFARARGCRIISRKRTCTVIILASFIVGEITARDKADDFRPAAPPAPRKYRRVLLCASSARDKFASIRV